MLCDRCGDHGSGRVDRPRRPQSCLETSPRDRSGCLATPPVELRGAVQHMSGAARRMNGESLLQAAVGAVLLEGASKVMSMRRQG